MKKFRMRRDWIWNGRPKNSRFTNYKLVRDLDIPSINQRIKDMRNNLLSKEIARLNREYYDRTNFTGGSVGYSSIGRITEAYNEYKESLCW